VIGVVVPALEERRKKFDQPLFPRLDRRYPLYSLRKHLPKDLGHAQRGSKPGLFSDKGERPVFDG
jgi:hypothetical protein